MAPETDWRLPRTYTGASGDVRWDRLGHPGRPPVVLLHGTPFSSYVRRAVARPLARYPRVFVRDMPGYGTSEKDGPGRVPGRPGPGLHRAPEPLGPQRTARGRPRLRRSRRPAGPSAARRPLSGPRPGGSGRAGTVGVPVLPARRRARRRRDPGPLQRDRHPHARLLGEDDTWIPVAKGRELAALVPGAQFEPVAGAGHLVQTAPWCVSTSVPPAAPACAPPSSTGSTWTPWSASGATESVTQSFHLRVRAGDVEVNPHEETALEPITERTYSRPGCGRGDMRSVRRRVLHNSASNTQHRRTRWGHRSREKGRWAPCEIVIRQPLDVGLQRSSWCSTTSN